jgi:hypothetical protein
MSRSLFVAALSALVATPAAAQVVTGAQFQNGIAISGRTQDLSGYANALDRRVGFFSDIYYDRNSNEWWGVGDRGPGGGTLPYDTRVQRFTVSYDAQGRISNFNVVQTIVFKENGVPLNGLAPNPSGTLGRSFDPEGIVVNPLNGNLIVADEYGPTVAEFDRSGNLVRRFTVPANLVPKVGSTPDYNQAPTGAAGGLTSGREPNRGFEGLAVSPDGKYVYAVLQDGTIQDGWTSAGGGTRGLYTRIVKYDMQTGQSVGQYAYRLNSVSQGRGISALVALGNDKFLILERNNRGIGVGATLASPDKKVYQIDLTGATDVTNINLPGTGNLPSGVVGVTKSANPVIDLAANTLSALGNKVPEKWEGLAIGPQLANGKYMILAGTDNDFSVTQNGTNTQFDVWYDLVNQSPTFDAYANSIQCPTGQVVNCFLTANGAAVTLDPSVYSLLPGVLHSYTADINGFVTPVPEPTSIVLTAFGLVGVAAASRRRRR